MVMVLIFGEVDVALDEKGEDRGVMIITVVDSQLESLIPASLQVLNCTYYNNAITPNLGPNSHLNPLVMPPVIRERGATKLIPSLIPHSTSTEGIFHSFCSIFTLTL